MKIAPTAEEIHNLFDNNNPKEVWQKIFEIIRLISPEFNFSTAQTTFDDVIRLFEGQYPGYCQIKTLYHNLHHTMDVVLCAVRLMHGVHLSGTALADDDITIVIMAALMHDVGYAQYEGEDIGTGAQHTPNHVNRSIEFMHSYIADKHLSAAWATPLKSVILCSNPMLNISDISFSDDHTRLLGSILGTADLTGQMADRSYLEKLLFLYLEFEEAGFSNYQNVHDMLRKTQIFYEATQLRLREQFGSINSKLALHFKDRYGTEQDYYLESIEKNLIYLSKITALNDAKHLTMLKRGGIVERSGSYKRFIP